MTKLKKPKIFMFRDNWHVSGNQRDESGYANEAMQQACAWASYQNSLMPPWYARPRFRNLLATGSNTLL